MEDYDVIILGGGLTGLSAGYKLSEKNKKVLIIEKSDELGGLLGSIETKGCPIEKYYHHVFKGDKNFFELIKDLGIEDKFDWIESTLGFYNNGKIHDMSTPLYIFRYSPLTLIEKLKFAFLGAKIKLIGFLKEKTEIGKKLEKIPAKEWVIRNTGKNVYEKFFSPLLKSKYGENLDKISAFWFIERINLRTTGGIKKERLGYLDGGFKILIENLEKNILKNGGKIVNNKTADKLLIDKNEVKGVVLNGKKIKSNHVISTIPLPELSKYNEIPKKFRDKISSIKYQGAICLIFGMDKKLTDFYWTNIIDDSLIGAIIEHTNFQPLENYKDHIVYLASYPNYISNVWKLSGKKVFERYFKELKTLFPKLKKEDIKWWELSRDKNAGIVYEIGYHDKRVGYKAPVKNLFLGGMFNIYPERSVEGAVLEGNKLSELILS